MSKEKIAVLVFLIFVTACSEPEPTQMSPPEGLHIGWPIEAYGVVDGVKFEVDESKRILERLNEENIETKFVTYYGEEYLVWQEKDNEAVKKIIDNRK